MNCDLKKALEHLRKRDKTFSILEKQVGEINFKPKTLNFESLLMVIINQQLSSKAANSIFRRLKGIFKNSVEITPRALLKIKPLELRQVGLSYSKIGFMKNLADKLLQNPNLLNYWDELNDDEALSQIQKLSGFGPWSANIILLSYMNRPDVFPFGDTTLKKAYLKIYGQNLSKDLKEIEWSRPYRSTLARYFWRWVDNGMKQL